MGKIGFFFTLVLVLLVVAGCGNKKPPVPPSELFGIATTR